MAFNLTSSSPTTLPSFLMDPTSTMIQSTPAIETINAVLSNINPTTVSTIFNSIISTTAANLLISPSSSTAIRASITPVRNSITVAIGTLAPQLFNLTTSTFAGINTELVTTSSVITTAAPNRTTIPSSSASSSAPEISLFTLHCIFILNGIMSLLGILGNIFVCLIIARGRKMYTIANLFLMNLAIADMCVLLISYPMWVLQTLTPYSWPFGAVMCKILPSISDAFYGVSLGCMTAISVHRYRMILHAMDRQLTIRQAKFVVIFIWFISLATISAPLYPVLQFREGKVVTNVTTDNTFSYTMCGSVWPTKTYETGYQIFLAIAWYLLPLLIILFTFLRIKWYLEKQMAYDWLKGSNTVLVANHIMGIKKALRMLAPIVIIFALLMLPWNVIRMISILINTGAIPHFQIYIVVAGTMLIANSVVNPFIYYLISSEFRLEFKKQFWLLKKRFGIVKHSDRFTIAADKKGRKFVRRFESFAENDSNAYGYRPPNGQRDSKYFASTTETIEIADITRKQSTPRFSPMNSPNENTYGELFPCDRTDGRDSDYVDLRYSESQRSPSDNTGLLYRIAEERSVDIDFKDFENDRNFHENREGEEDSIECENNGISNSQGNIRNSIKSNASYKNNNSNNNNNNSPKTSIERLYDFAAEDSDDTHF